MDDVHDGPTELQNDDAPEEPRSGIETGESELALAAFRKRIGGLMQGRETVS
jgi:hypothetical protein